eukprot:g10263.t1
MTPARRGKEGDRGGLASKLFNKFDSDRKYDPFLDTDPVIQDSKEGMEALLSMCNAVEINSLFGALGFVVPCPRSAKEQQIMAYIREGGRQVEKKFAYVLKFCWEGLLYEYLRTVGCPLRDREHDPRHFVMRYWRRSMLDPSVKPGFVPYYAKREIKRRKSIMQEDKDLRDIRAGLALREELVKDAEARIRGQHDYRFVLQYFSASRDLHRTLAANVNYLASEVEQLRANMDHNSESIAIMEHQFVELETKYDRVVGGLVHRGAFQLTLESTLYGMINEGHDTIKNAERVANELLDSMATGPERYDCVDETFDNSNNNNNDKDDVSPAEPPAAGGPAAVNESKTKQSAATSDHKRWAAARSRAGSNRPTSSDQERSAEHKMATSAAAIATAAETAAEEEAIATEKTEEGTICRDRRDGGGNRNGDCQLSLGLCLGQVQETHRRACTRYANQVAQLEAQNAGLVAAAAEASRLEAEAAAQTKSWEAKHDALEERLAEVEKRSREELAQAEHRATEACSQSLEAANLLTEKLDRATPTLLKLVAAFAPLDTEGPGVDLFRSLGIDPDLYVHHLARKRMFEADLESRALEIVDAERKIALAEAEAAEQEEAQEAPNSGGKKKKGDRGRPKSKGKAGGGADKGKSGGNKSRSRSPAGKGMKKSSEKNSGSKAAEKAASKEKKKPAGKGAKPASAADKTRSGKAEGGAGKENKEAGKKPSSADYKRAQSPAKKGGAGKGGQKKK